MDILSFSRIKARREDGRLLAILRLRLPRLPNELTGADAFNLFYSALAEAYSSLLERLEATPQKYARPITLSVDFSVLGEECPPKYSRAVKKCAQPIVIKRFATITRGELMRCIDYTDVYDASASIFVK